MRILLLTFYYEPDLCAGSFRATALVRALQKKGPGVVHVDVITTIPNRYSTFNVSAPEFERNGSISIRRIPLPPHKSGMRDQSRAFLVFAQGVKKHIEPNGYDLVIATSSRLMTAALGAHIARKVGAPLYLDIRDIFVDTMKNILPHWSALLMALPLEWVENYAMRTAVKINLVSRGFENYFKGRYPAKPLAFFSNGIDQEFQCLAVSPDEYVPSEKPYSILYAGNLGEGQGLHEIIPALASAMNKKIEFTIIGDGGRKPQLQRIIHENKLDNVTVMDPVDRLELVKAYQRADVLFLHLNDHDAFKKVLPSKLFEYAATGKPIWAGVGGYAATFVSNEIENSAVFPPCNAKAAIEAFKKLQIIPTSRTEFIRKYDRNTIMDAFADDILSVYQERTP